MNYKSFLTGLKLLYEIQRNNFICRCLISIRVHYINARDNASVNFPMTALFPNDELKYIIMGPIYGGVIVDKSFSRLCTARLYCVRYYLCPGFRPSFSSPLIGSACQGLKTVTRSSYCFSVGI